MGYLINDWCITRYCNFCSVHMQMDLNLLLLQDIRVGQGQQAHPVPPGMRISSALLVPPINSQIQF